MQTLEGYRFLGRTVGCQGYGGDQVNGWDAVQKQEAGRDLAENNVQQGAENGNHLPRQGERAIATGGETSPTSNRDHKNGGVSGHRD